MVVLGILLVEFHPVLLAFVMFIENATIAKLCVWNHLGQTKLMFCFTDFLPCTCSSDLAGRFKNENIYSIKPNLWPYDIMLLMHIRSSFPLFVLSFVCLLIHSLLGSFVLTLVHSYFHLVILMLVCLSARSFFIHSFVVMLVCSFIRSFVRLLYHVHTFLPTQSNFYAGAD